MEETANQAQNYVGNQYNCTGTNYGYGQWIPSTDNQVSYCAGATGPSSYTSAFQSLNEWVLANQICNQTSSTIDWNTNFDWNAQLGIYTAPTPPEMSYNDLTREEKVTGLFALRKEGLLG